MRAAAMGWCWAHCRAVQGQGPQEQGPQCQGPGPHGRARARGRWARGCRTSCACMVGGEGEGEDGEHMRWNGGGGRGGLVIVAMRGASQEELCWRGHEEALAGSPVTSLPQPHDRPNPGTMAHEHPPGPPLRAPRAPKPKSARRTTTPSPRPLLYGHCLNTNPLQPLLYCPFFTPPTLLPLLYGPHFTTPHTQDP